jgi:hypothetical protein
VRLGPPPIVARLRMKRTFYALIMLALLGFATAGRAVVIDQIDDFQDGTTMNWANGGIIGTIPVRNIPTGGPAGEGDAYIQLTADGSGAGGKLTAWNREQWLGSYVNAGVTAIQVDLINQSAVTLSIRMAFKTGPGSQGVPGYLTQAMILPVGSGWQHFTISLLPDNLIPVGGPAPWSSFFIGEVRFIHEVGTSNLSGDNVVGQLGIDNIHAVPEPATTVLATVGFIALAIYFKKARHRLASDL